MVRNFIMNAGIDFGTSNCSVGIWENNKPNILNLEGNSISMPSALYTSKEHIEVEAISEVELAKRIRKSKTQQINEARKAKEEGRKYKVLDDNKIENIERGVLRREMAEAAKKLYDNQDVSSSLKSDNSAVFGTAAITQHLREPHEGFFIKSPKTFLGAELGSNHIEVFSEVTKKILSHIKHESENTIGSTVENVVLGKPIKFHGTMGDKGNLQALGILESSAITAGFKDIEFLYEPIAAALDYERTLNKDIVVLVMDIGGGTTDCSMLKVGPSYIDKIDRDESLLGYSGDRIGGMDLDIKLANSILMPYFGKDSLLDSGLRIPSMYYSDAVYVNDVQAQFRFSSEKYGREIRKYYEQAINKNKVSRLLRLYEGNYSYSLNRSSESAKINLSEKESIQLPIEYIDPDLVIDISRKDYKDAIEMELQKIIGIMTEVTKQSSVIPDVIYVTGGTAKSPIIESLIRKQFKDIDIVSGDMFGSVVKGLTTWAHRIWM